MERSAWVSDQNMRIVRRAMLANSFSTCTLIVPLPTMIVSAQPAFTGWPDATYTRTLVSTKLSDVRLIPIEFEVGWQASAKGAEALQQFLPPCM